LVIRRITESIRKADYGTLLLEMLVLIAGILLALAADRWNQVSPWSGTKNTQKLVGGKNESEIAHQNRIILKSWWAENGSIGVFG
jgi:hypothetical protein